ncbi:MAG: PhnA domain-containing protein [Crocinitomicaceae bacterium]|nr:PhnA domain-containing protein [Crocinitomicaceae bacterium]
MSLEKELAARSGGSCELCGATGDLNIFVVAPKKGDSANDLVHTCNTCNGQLTQEVDVDPNHWRCLNDSMWSEVSVVKVVALRMLNQLKGEGWPNDLIDMMYLEEDDMKWAKEGIEDESEEKIIHRDSNGVVLSSGDSVVVVKDLKVSGSSLVAKRGTAVRNISLVYDNAEQIEGKVEGQTVVLLTKYLKK